jgi:hypothetical protein
MFNSHPLSVDTTHPKPGAGIMNTFAPTTQTASGTVERATTIGSVCKAAGAIAIVGMISLLSIAQLNRAQFAPSTAMDHTHQSELPSLLCRIDRRCPAMDLTHQSPPVGKTGDQTGALLGRTDSMIE